MNIIFEVSLIRLLRRRPDRLLIEPTGLAALSGRLDTLEKEGIREAVDVKSIVYMLDIGRLRDHTQRVKTVVHTNEDWWRFNFIGEVEEQWPSGYRRDSRLEVIFEGGDQADLEELERSLRACVISPSASL